MYKVLPVQKHEALDDNIKVLCLVVIFHLNSA